MRATQQLRKRGVKKVYYINFRRDLNIIFWFLSSVKFLRTLNYSQLFQEQVAIFSSVIILSEKKNTEYSCTWIYFNIFLSMIYLIWCIWFTWWKSFTLPPSYVSSLPLPEGSFRPPIGIFLISRFEMILAWM